MSARGGSYSGSFRQSARVGIGRSVSLRREETGSCRCPDPAVSQSSRIQSVGFERIGPSAPVVKVSYQMHRLFPGCVEPERHSSAPRIDRTRTDRCIRMGFSPPRRIGACFTFCHYTLPHSMEFTHRGRSGESELKVRSCIFRAA